MFIISYIHNFVPFIYIIYYHFVCCILESWCWFHILDCVEILFGFFLFRCVIPILGRFRSHIFSVFLTISDNSQLFLYHSKFTSAIYIRHHPPFTSAIFVATISCKTQLIETFSHHQLQYALSNGIIIYLFQAFRLIQVQTPEMVYNYTINQWVLQLMMT